jgi:hypothetical protein
MNGDGWARRARCAREDAARRAPERAMPARAAPAGRPEGPQALGAREQQRRRRRAGESRKRQGWKPGGELRAAELDAQHEPGPARSAAQGRRPGAAYEGAGARPAAPAAARWSWSAEAMAPRPRAAPAAEPACRLCGRQPTGGGNRPTVRLSGEGLIGIEILIHRTLLPSVGSLARFLPLSA